MIVKIVCDKGKHNNLYEGNHVGFHAKGSTWKEGVTVVVEGRNGKDCVTIEVEKGSDTQLYLMNDQGKTVEKIFV